MVKQRFRATSYDVAEAAGVSQSTVSRALSGDPIVAAATRERIVEAARRLNYHIDSSASRMRSGRLNTIAVVVICPEDEDVRAFNLFHYALLGGICAAASARGMETIVSFQGAPDRLDDHFERSRRAIGMIVFGTSENRKAWDYFQASADDGCHVVCWGAPAPAHELPWVRADNHGGARAAVEHLLDHGYRRIVYVGEADCPQRQFAERYDAYAETLVAAGLTPRIMTLEPGFSRHEQGRRAAAALLEAGEPFDGLFTACDDIALGAMALLEERGLSVPGDVGVVGFDGVKAGQFSVPPLTTIEPDFAVAGQQLVDRLQALVDDKEMAQERVPVRLVVRGSALGRVAAPV
jgi:DNA-binding LacI/PurR family transcriptional regulator